MDEPTNHLDVRAQLHTLGLLRSLAAEGTAVLAAIHDLNLASRYADHVIVIDRGRVVASGAPATALTPWLIGAVYGAHAEVIPHPVDGTPLIAFSERTPDPTLSAPTGEGGVRSAHHCAQHARLLHSKDSGGRNIRKEGRR